MSATEILEQIRRLSPEEQYEIVLRVQEEFADVGDELTGAQIAELDRRAEEALKNPGSGVPWEQLRDETLRNLKK